MIVAKLMHSIEAGTERDLGDYVWFWCPGCAGYHRARVRMPDRPTDQEIADQQANRQGLWTWNGNESSPTIRASILLGIEQSGKRCHSFVTDGRIEYCTDSQHALSGQTIDLPEIEL
ncbi:MAG: uncharacterized protein JWR50_608 [Mucilaginibacter sp.]|nr:uncharacterized protein [Mucilaginibacter sp.]